MSTFDSDMTTYESEWEQWEPREQSGDFGPVIPDGQHQALLVDIAIRQRQSDDHWQLYEKFQNSQGSVRAWRDLDHEIGRDIAMNDITVLGFEHSEAPAGERWQAFRTFVESKQSVGMVCNIGVRTRAGDTRDFTDVFVNQCLGKAEDEALFAVDPNRVAQAAHDERERVQAAASDDDIPF